MVACQEYRIPTRNKYVLSTPFKKNIKMRQRSQIVVVYIDYSNVIAFNLLDRIRGRIKTSALDGCRSPIVYVLVSVFMRPLFPKAFIKVGRFLHYWLFA